MSPDDPGGLDVIPTETAEWVAGDVAHRSAAATYIACMAATDRTAVSVHVYGRIPSNSGRTWSKSISKPRPPQLDGGPLNALIRLQG